VSPRAEVCGPPDGPVVVQSPKTLILETKVSKTSKTGIKGGPIGGNAG